MLPSPVTYSGISSSWLFRPRYLGEIEGNGGGTLTAGTTVETGSVSPSLNASSPAEALSGSVAWAGSGIGYISNTEPEPAMGVTWDGVSGWTLEWWFNWSMGNGNAVCRVKNDSTDRCSIGLSGGGGSGTFVLYFEVNGVFFSALNSLVGDLTGWHHAAMVVYPVDTAARARFWLDGADPVANGTTSGTSQGWVVPQSAFRSANTFEASWTNQVGPTLLSHGSRYTKAPLYLAPFTPPVF